MINVRDVFSIVDIYITNNMNSITGGSVQQYVDMRHGILSVDCFELHLYIFLVLPKKTIMTKLPDQVLVAYFAQIW